MSDADSSRTRPPSPDPSKPVTRPPTAGVTGSFPADPGTGAWSADRASPPSLPGAEDLPRDFGCYRLEKLLGKGGMGAVYLARDTQLGRLVALKIPSLSGCNAQARFLREAQAAAALAHPNICPVHDLGEIDGVPFLTMTFISGEPLSQRLGAGPMDPGTAASLIRKAALALEEAHQHGVIHRDLKPANIMIDARGEPVVMDFGLARRDDLAHLTHQGDVMGTPSYMPPEQLAGDVQAMGPGCDVYSLGVVLYELLTGQVPFKGDLISLMTQVQSDEPAPPSAHRPGLDPRLDAICLKALAKRPADRWRSMRELADALGSLAEAPVPPGAPLGRPAPVTFAQGPTGARAASPTTEATPMLTLRVEGTPFAYRPAPGQDLITLGRQKRKLGDPPDHGNDVVLRVPGNDHLSARISRRHLDIQRSGSQLFVTDHSKGGTLHNGRPLPRDVPTPLNGGDRLVIAGVLTLEVMLQAGLATGRIVPQVEVTQGVSATAPAILEATCGDMITVE